MKEFPKISIKMKNFKTFCEARQGNYSAPHQTKASHVSETKISLRRDTRVYRYLLSKCFVNAFLGCLEMMQCKFFLTPTRNMFAGKLVK